MERTQNQVTASRSHGNANTGEGMQQTSKSTSTLLRRLLKTHNFRDFFGKNEEAMQVPNFCTYIAELSRASEQTQEHIIRRSAIERTYGHQLFNGTRKPSRDKVIQLAFGFGMDVDGTQDMLRIACKSLLYPKIKRDAAILYCIGRGADIMETQTLLLDLGLDLLGGE